MLPKLWFFPDPLFCVKHQHRWKGTMLFLLTPNIHLPMREVIGIVFSLLFMGVPTESGSLIGRVLTHMETPLESMGGGWTGDKFREGI